VLDSTHPLTTEERAALRRLIIQDAVALVSLLLIIVVLSGLTYLLFHSFKSHELDLAQRWKHRGEVALEKGDPNVAIDALRSSLAYQSDRSTEIELAEALAKAGRVHEAVAYFNTLRDSEPGSGIINLQLARLAARQKLQTQAIDYYQTAIDGTWEGDGYQRRRDVRLELAQYLISIHEFTRARNQLLIAAGNAPNQPVTLLKVAGMLEQCESSGDALQIYRTLAKQREPSWQALAGAGRTAYQLGQFALALRYLDRALYSRQFTAQPATVQATIRNMQSTTSQILALYPGADLTIRERALRVLHNVTVARKRFNSCEAPIAANAPAVPANPIAPATPPLLPPALQANTLAQANQATAKSLAARWAKFPRNPSLFRLEQNPQMEQSLMQLVYDTELDAAKQCGPPQGDDALLYRIAQAPYAVEQR
jgi:tetratricopeptide (TPR) repeat protein